MRLRHGLRLLWPRLIWLGHTASRRYGVLLSHLKKTRINTHEVPRYSALPLLCRARCLPQHDFSLAVDLKNSRNIFKNLSTQRLNMTLAQGGALDSGM